MNAQPEPVTAASPWSPPVRLVVAASLAAGAVLIVTAWVGTRHKVDVESQTSVAAVAVAGFTCVALGVAGWVLTGRAQVEARIYRVVAQGQAPGGLAVAPIRIVGSRPKDGTPLASGEIVATTAMHHYHRPSCVMASGKPVVAASLAAHLAAGRRACEVCEPDE